MPHILKGQSAPLNVTKQAHHRIFVGIGWDPNVQTGLWNHARALLSRKRMAHDLDLTCTIFDAAERIIGQVSTKDGHTRDQTGHIYHSGDNDKGLGDGDDEQISVELKDLDPAIAHIVFTVSIPSGHTFDEIQSPEIRLADGYTGHDFLSCALKSLPDHVGSRHFAFVRLSRDHERNGWSVQNVSAFKSP